MERKLADPTFTPNGQTRRRHYRALRCTALLICLGLTLLFPCVARAATVSWVNSAGGVWSLGSNWSTGTPPGQTEVRIRTYG